MKKIFSVIGARPQFVKAAAVSRAFSQSSVLNETIIHTGQHFDEEMSDVFFREMGIPEPAWNLGISGGSHGSMTGRMLIELEKVILRENPDCILIYGDTNSTLAGALAGAINTTRAGGTDAFENQDTIQEIARERFNYTF